ncbi:hypothetical protein BpHYR1_028270 [Brachionus plicatilis]|uniref:Uncharacterized protein n=1 Tax=Brachionus plicatilis TaxID=10195 RepID=A0A3M7PXI7_BRAPC|nr:hypothetical protein BpHYR1_028270 [Brachionus plicatilis]
MLKDLEQKNNNWKKKKNEKNFIFRIYLLITKIKINSNAFYNTNIGVLNFTMPFLSEREAVLKAHEALRNTNDTQSIASDDNDADFLDDDNFLDEFDELDAVDEDSNERDILFEEVDDTNQYIIDSIRLIEIYNQ